MSITIQNGRGTHCSLDTCDGSITHTYGATAYLIALGTFLYVIGLVTQYIMPRTLDVGATPLPKALVVNLLLLLNFAVQHSGMARQGFKRLFARFASPVIERSSYVLLASLTLLLLLFWQWQPIPMVV